LRGARGVFFDDNNIFSSIGNESKKMERFPRYEKHTPNSSNSNSVLVLESLNPKGFQEGS
jgi:hypothetical protein